MLTRYFMDISDQQEVPNGQNSAAGVVRPSAAMAG
jgi:hypothetical protein